MLQEAHLSCQAAGVKHAKSNHLKSSDTNYGTENHWPLRNSVYMQAYDKRFRPKFKKYDAIIDRIAIIFKSTVISNHTEIDIRVKFNNIYIQTCNNPCERSNFVHSSRALAKLLKADSLTDSSIMSRMMVETNSSMFIVGKLGITIPSFAWLYQLFVATTFFFNPFKTIIELKLETSFYFYSLGGNISHLKLLKIHFSVDILFLIKTLKHLGN